MTATVVRERPILFSAPMVRAILAGRKTQTRRVVKPQPTHRLIEGLGHVTKGMDPADDGAVWYDADCIGPGREVRCPYGRVGDRLWVRETWAKVASAAADWCIYRADGDTFLDEPVTWRPSIHMPRWASRITLEITGVRVERLQEISGDDAKAEGVDPIMVDSGGVTQWDEPIDVPDYVEPFADLWAHINGPESWASNPWVWVVEFRRLEVSR